jgi:DNA repair photolyase
MISTRTRSSGLPGERSTTMIDEVHEPGDPIRGRGAVRNVTGRFQRSEVVPFDDGWGSLDEAAPALETTFSADPSRTILSRNDSPDVPFDRSINPYKGCEHGCVYCFARPTHSYLDLSPGLDFESRIFHKPHAAELLRRELRRPRYECTTIALGTNTDPYQPGERRLRITRSILETLHEFRHPLTVVTKSNLVLRDLDLLAPMARDNLAAVFLSITTLDRTLARRMEPRAPTPDRRLTALRELSRAGVRTGVLASPMIPGLNDSELEAVLEAAAAAGARYAGTILVRLPWEVAQLFGEWLDAHYPGRAAKVLGRLREMRGGRLNDPRFDSRMRGSGPHAKLLNRRFEIACRRLGLSRDRFELDRSRFRVPLERGDQLALFAPGPDR